MSLASVVGAVVSLSAALGGEQLSGGYLRAVSVVLFVSAAALAIWALRVREHAGFHDGGTFSALAYDGMAVDWFPEFKDKDPFRLYLRELCMQRWAVYRRIKAASNKKADRVAWAQYAALAGAVVLVLSVLVQVRSSKEASPPAPAKAAASAPR